MSAPTYSVIFRGDLQPGYTAADVKANFARLFKAGPDAVEKLFSGRPLAIKKGLGQAQAEQLQTTLAKLGALSSLKVEGEAAAAERPAATQAAEAPSAKVEAADVPLAPQTEDVGSGLSLAPMEGNLLKEHERSRVEPVQVSVNHLSLKPPGGNLVEASEQSAPPPVQVEVPDWQLGGATGKASFKLPD